MANIKLYYFNAKGRMEVPRWILEYGGMEYEDVRFEREQWPEHKSKMPFGQVPVMEVDGVMISQCGAICEYLAKKTGLSSNDDLIAAKIRMICDQSEDMLKPIMHIHMEKDEGKKAELKKKYEEDLAGFLGNFEKYLEKNNCDGHFVGGKMSLADLVVANHLTFPELMGIKFDLEKFPKLKAVAQRVNNHPKIAAWIAKRPVTQF